MINLDIYTDHNYRPLHLNIDIHFFADNTIETISVLSATCMDTNEQVKDSELKRLTHLAYQAIDEQDLEEEIQQKHYEQNLEGVN